MKSAKYILLSLVLCLAACQPDPIPTPIPSPQTGIERTIVYAVGNAESHCTLETEAEWDALLDRLCDYAASGNEVAFFNTSHFIAPHNSSKESTNISTADREELKRWMKAMEKEGLTVRVTYDDNSGTWNGTAYATAPAHNTEGDIVGIWHLNCMVATQLGPDGSMISSDLYAPDEDGGTMSYTFSADGTLTLTFNGMDGTTATESSTWTISDDGVMCCDLLPNGGCWNVNWLTPNTMVISRLALGTADGDLYYQLQFDRQ